MRIEAFLRESPMFTVKRAARHFDRIAAEAFSPDDLGFMEGLLLAAIFSRPPVPLSPPCWPRPSLQRAANVSHAISSLEAKGLVQRRIDPADARGTLLALKPQAKVRPAHHRRFDRMQQKFEQKVGKTR